MINILCCLFLKIPFIILRTISALVPKSLTNPFVECNHTIFTFVELICNDFPLGIYYSNS